MVDIWGRSKKREKSSGEKITDEIKKMIKDEIANNFNLASVDPGEIVVFETNTGKLKTSNISFDSLLTRPEGVTDDSIAVFKQGKITAGDKLSSITGSVTKLRNEYEAHINNYATLRRNFNTADNTIEKFFGKKNIKPDEVTTTLPDLKKSIEDIKTITDKVKIPHDVNDIKGISCVVFQELNNEYINPNPKLVLIRRMTIAGIYRFTVFSEHQFNIHIINGFIQQIEQIAHKGTNTVLFLYDLKKDYFATVKPVDSTVVRAKFGCILEYVSAI